MSSPHTRRSSSHGRSASMANSDRRRPRSASRTPSCNGRSGERSPHEPRSRSRSGSRSRSFTRSLSRSTNDSPDAPAIRSAKIVIEKLSKNVREAHLHDIFGAYGRIETIDMPLVRPFLTNRGIAYVVYAQPEFAENAIAHMDEAQLDGAQISVSVVLPRRRRSPSPLRRYSPERYASSRHLARDDRTFPSGAERSYRPSASFLQHNSTNSRGRGRQWRSPRESHRERGARGAGLENNDYSSGRRDHRRRSYSGDRGAPTRRSRSPRYSSRSPSADAASSNRHRTRTPLRERDGPSRGRRDSYSSYSSRSSSRSYDRNRDRR